ncbi:uncharacterized protein V6R79_012162 [Siganus canaliculatus]
MKASYHVNAGSNSEQENTTAFAFYEAGRTAGVAFSSGTNSAAQDDEYKGPEQIEEWDQYFGCCRLPSSSQPSVFMESLSCRSAGGQTVFLTQLLESPELQLLPIERRPDSVDVDEISISERQRHPPPVQDTWKPPELSLDPGAADILPKDFFRTSLGLLQDFFRTSSGLLQDFFETFQDFLMTSGFLMGSNNLMPVVPGPGGRNDSFPAAHLPLTMIALWPPGFLLAFTATSLSEVMNHCHVQTGQMVWFGLKLFILVTSLPANAGLLWALLSRKAAMTPSVLLGLNVSIMGVLYCLCLPLDIYSTLHPTSETTHRIREALFALNMIGCPLLLTFMTLERYVAVAWPLAYQRLGSWQCRVLLCATVWTLTLAVGLLGFFLGLMVMVLPLSVTISLFFLVMLVCLLEIVRALCRSRPGEGSGSGVALKRRALKNVLAVMVPVALAYAPLVAVVPYMVINRFHESQSISTKQCHILQLLLLFPNFGLFIGPMFYLSYLRQMTCCSKDQTTTVSRTEDK